MPPDQDYQGRASHELDGELSPDEVDPEDKSDTHEESSQEVCHGDQEHDPLIELEVKVGSIQQSSVPLSKLFVIPLANIACQEDQKDYGYDDDRYEGDDGKDTTQSDESEVGVPVVLLDIEKGVQCELNVRLYKESRRSSPEEKVFELVGIFLDLWAKAREGPHQNKVEPVEAHNAEHDVELRAKVLNQESAVMTSLLEIYRWWGALRIVGHLIRPFFSW